MVLPRNPCSRACPSPRRVEDGSHGSWMLDFIYLFLLVAERNSLPVPMPRKRRPQSSPPPSDQSQQPPVPRPRSKLTEVAMLALLGGTLSQMCWFPAPSTFCMHMFSCMWPQGNAVILVMRSVSPVLLWLVKKHGQDF